VLAASFFPSARRKKRGGEKRGIGEPAAVQHAGTGKKEGRKDAPTARRAALVRCGTHTRKKKKKKGEKVKWVRFGVGDQGIQPAATPTKQGKKKGKKKPITPAGQCGTPPFTCVQMAKQKKEKEKKRRKKTRALEVSQVPWLQPLLRVMFLKGKKECEISRRYHRMFTPCNFLHFRSYTMGLGKREKKRGNERAVHAAQVP